MDAGSQHLLGSSGDFGSLYRSRDHPDIHASHLVSLCEYFQAKISLTSVSKYIIDVYLSSANSAIAINTCVRTIVGAWLYVSFR